VAFISGPAGPFPYPTDNATLNTAMGSSGKNSTSIWLFDQTSGNATDDVGSNDLAPIDSPTQAADGVTFVDNTADSMDNTTASTNLDVATGSFAIMMACTLPSTSTNSTNLVQKRENGSGFEGYEIIKNGSSLSATLDGVTTTSNCGSNAIFDTSGDIHILLWVIDMNADTHKIHDSSGTTTSATAPSGVGSMSNTEDFSFGQGPVRNACGYKLVWACFWEGAQAEGLGLTERDNFATYVGEN